MGKAARNEAGIALRLRHAGLLARSAADTGAHGRPATRYALTRAGEARLAYYEAHGCASDGCACGAPRSRSEYAQRKRMGR